MHKIKGQFVWFYHFFKPLLCTTVRQLPRNSNYILLQLIMCQLILFWEVVVFFHDTPMVCVCVCAILMRAFVEFYSIDMNLPQSVAVFIVGADAAWNHCATWWTNTRIGWISCRMHHIVWITIAGWSVRWRWCIQTTVNCRYIDVG